jgi:hypothetical protein
MKTDRAVGALSGKRLRENGPCGNATVWRPRHARKPGTGQYWTDLPRVVPIRTQAVFRARHAFLFGPSTLYGCASAFGDDLNIAQRSSTKIAQKLTIHRDKPRLAF